MKEIEIIKYKQSPVPIPHPDEAWEDMRRRLPQEATQPTLPIAEPPHTHPGAKRLFARITEITLLLLLAALWPITLLTPTARSPRPMTARTADASLESPHTQNLSPHAQNLSPHARNLSPHTQNLSPHARNLSPHTRNLSPHTRNLIMANSPQFKNRLASPPRAGARPPLAPRETPAPPSDSTPYSAPLQPPTPTNQNAQRHPTPKNPQPDSATESPTNLAQPERIILQAGLQWTAQIPTGNTGAYLAGTNGHTHLYRPLLPAAWVHLQYAKSLFEIGFDPFYSGLVPSHPFSRDNNTATRSDTSVTTNQTQTLRKLFGISAKAGYATAIGSHWWAGGGIETIFWAHAIALTRTQETRQPLGNPGSGVSQTFNSTAALSKTEWRNNFSNFQLNVYGQLLYNAQTWNAGFRAGFPFTVLSRNQGPSSPLRLEVFYRLPLLTRQIRAATPTPLSPE